MRQQLRPLLLLCLFLLLYAGKIFAENQGLVVKNGAQGTDYDWGTVTDGGGTSRGVLLIKTGTPLTISGETSTQVILIEEKVNADVTIENMKIGVPGSINDYPSLMKVSAKATLNLTLVGKNTIDAKINYTSARTTAIHVPAEATLIIKGDGELIAKSVIQQAISRSRVGRLQRLLIMMVVPELEEAIIMVVPVVPPPISRSKEERLQQPAVQAVPELVEEVAKDTQRLQLPEGLLKRMGVPIILVILIPPELAQEEVAVRITARLSLAAG